MNVIKPQQKRNNHLLEGSVVKSLIMISLPIIFANLLQSLYQFIDTYWVGRLGASSVAAVSLSAPILFFLNSLAIGFTMAGSILIAQYNGKGEKENVSLATGQTLSLVTIISLLITIFGYFSSHWILTHLTNDPLVLDEANIYLKISFLAMPASFIYIIFQSALRGVGEVKFPMIVILTTVIINYFIDPLFMNGFGPIPQMGVAGVAMATLITEYLSAIIAIIVMTTSLYQIQVKLHDIKLRLSWVKKIIVLGVPSSLEMSSRSFGMVLMMFIVSTFGTYTVAAYGIGSKILSFVIIPAIGISISTSILVGNNLGAKQHERVKEILSVAMRTAFIGLTVVGIIIFISANQISAFFVPGDQALIATSALFMRITSLTFGFIGIQMVVSGSVKAAGKTSTAMLMAMVNSFALFVLSYILSTILGYKELGIWVAYPIANILSFMFAFFIYKQKIWLKTEII